MSGGAAAPAAFVTGAGSGIGRAIARRLAADGMGVAVADIDAGRAAETETLIRAAGHVAQAVHVDVTDFAAVRAAVAAARDALGPIGVLVNNAGGDRLEPFVQNAPELWDRLIAINLKGPIYCTRAVLDEIAASRRGRRGRRGRTSVSTGIKTRSAQNPSLVRPWEVSFACENRLL